MRIKIAMDVRLSPDELEQVIRDYIKEKLPIGEELTPKEIQSAVITFPEREGDSRLFCDIHIHMVRGDEHHAGKRKRKRTST